MAQTILCDAEGHAPAVVLIQWLQTGQVNAACEEHLPVFVMAMADAVGLVVTDPNAAPPEPAPKPRKSRSRKIDVADGPEGARGSTSTDPSEVEPTGLEAEPAETAATP